MKNEIIIYDDRLGILIKKVFNQFCNWMVVIGFFGTLMVIAIGLGFMVMETLKEKRIKNMLYTQEQIRSVMKEDGFYVDEQGYIRRSNK